MSEPRHSRLGLYLPWGLFAAAALGWLIYWFAASVLLRDGLQAWIERERAGGAVIRHQPVRISGFPLRLTLTYPGFAYRAPSGWEVRADALSVHAMPYSLRRLILEPRIPMRVSTPNDQDLTLAGSNLAMSIRAGPNGLEHLSLHGEAMRLTPSVGAALSMESLGLDIRPDPRASTDYQLALQIGGLVPPAIPKALAVLGPRIESLRAGIVLTRGDRLSVAPPGWRFPAWAAAGGKARVEALELKWGLMHATGDGALTLDAEHRPEGRLTLSLTAPLPTEFGAEAGEARTALDFAHGEVTLAGAPIVAIPPLY